LVLQHVTVTTLL